MIFGICGGGKGVVNGEMGGVRRGMRSTWCRFGKRMMVKKIMRRMI